MPTLTTLALFAVVAAGFMALPGPSSLFVVARGLSQGTRPALFAAAGCATASSTYAIATAAGLAALIASSQIALQALHVVGGGYLLLLAVRSWRDRTPLAVAGEARAPASGWRSYRQGLVVELANPKVALFYLALFPQFVDPARGSAATQILVLGAVFVLIGLIADSAYGIASGRLARWLARRPSVAARQGRVAAVLYAGLGGWTLASAGSTSARH